MSDREKILFLLCAVFGMAWLRRAIKSLRGRAIHSARGRKQSNIAVNRVNLVRYALGARMMGLIALFVCMAAILMLLWRGGGMNGSALIASIIVISVVMIPMSLPAWMIFASIRMAFTACFADDMDGRFFEIDGDRLLCITESWFVCVCDMDSFVLHAPGIDFAKPVLQSERSIRTSGKTPLRLTRKGYRVFLKNGKSVFVSDAMIARIRKWMASARSFHGFGLQKS